MRKTAHLSHSFFWGEASHNDLQFSDNEQTPWRNFTAAETKMKNSCTLEGGWRQKTYKVNDKNVITCFNIKVDDHKQKQIVLCVPCVQQSMTISPKRNRNDVTANCSLILCCRCKVLCNTQKAVWERERESTGAPPPPSEARLLVKLPIHLVTRGPTRPARRTTHTHTSAPFFFSK